MSKKLVISSIIILIITLAGIGGWLYVTRSPEYSLVLAARTVKNHDYQGFKQYVDVDQIVSDLVNSAVSEIQKEVNQDTEGNPWAQLGANLGSVFISAYTPQLKEEFTDQVRKGVEEGNFGREGTDATKIKLLDFWTKTEVKREGKIAIVTIPTFHLQNDNPFSFKMRQSNGRWQVFSIDFDVSEIANKKTAADSASEGSSPSVSPEEAQFLAEHPDATIQGDIIYTVLKVLKQKEIKNSFSTTSANGIFHVVILNVANMGNTTGTVSTSEFRVIDDQGRSFDLSTDGQFAANMLLNSGETKIELSDLTFQQVQPSLPINGLLVFDLPDDATNLKLQVKRDLASSGGTINLQPFAEKADEELKEQ